jgi:hypothetical protein
MFFETIKTESLIAFVISSILCVVTMFLFLTKTTHFDSNVTNDEETNDEETNDEETNDEETNDEETNEEMVEYLDDEFIQKLDEVVEWFKEQENNVELPKVKNTKCEKMKK